MAQVSSDIRTVARASSYAPLVMPNQRGRVISDFQQAHQIATTQGFKGIEVPDSRYATYLINGITLMQFNNLGAPGTLGVATGGTFEPARYAFGLPDFMNSVFGMKLPVDNIPYVGTLDDYAHSLATYLRLEKEIRPEMEYLLNHQLPWTYRGEQLVWLTNAGFSPEQLISPELRYTWSGKETAGRFDRSLSQYVGETEVQFTGAGIHGHRAFRERRWNTDFAQMNTDFIKLHASTKFTNGNNFVPSFLGEEPKMNMMFRNIMAAWGLSSRWELLEKCDQIRRAYNGTMPKELDYVDQSDFEDFLSNFDSYLERATLITTRMPQYGVTQGVADHRSKLELNAQTGGHKRLSLLHTLEGPIDSQWPVSFTQSAGNPSSVVIFDRAAAGLLQHRENYFRFEPDTATTRIIEEQFASDYIEAMFWANYTPRIVW